MLHNEITDFDQDFKRFEFENEEVFNSSKHLFENFEPDLMMEPLAMDSTEAQDLHSSMHNHSPMLSSPHNDCVDHDTYSPSFQSFDDFEVP